MPPTHDPRLSDQWPTEQFPVLEPARVYRASDHRRRLAIGVGAGAAGLVVVVALIWGLTASHGSPAPVAAAPAPTVATSPPTTAPTQSATTQPATTAPTTAAPTTASPLDPKAAVAQLQDVLASLKDDDKIDGDAARSLEKRLDDVADKIKDGDREGATRKLDQFAKKLVDLQKDDDLDTTGFQTLAAGANEVAQSLPQVQED